MKVTTLDESVIQDIGHAFGYYDYGTERGLINAFPSRKATAVYISGYVRMTLRGGILYSTGENGCALSGGERQRISIARAFLKDAPIILLDEATASLDVENETLIQTALSRLIQNKIVLIIAHRMRTVAGADKIVVLSSGRPSMARLTSSMHRTEYILTWCSFRPAARIGRSETRKHEGGDGLCAATALSFLTKAASDDTIHPLTVPRG